MILPIVCVPDERLTTATREVEVITDELHEILDNMRETMIASDGIGLAAPQVGLNISVAIIQLDEEDDLFELINPTITHKSGSEIDVEGCLSIPHRYGTVERAEEVTVTYYNRDGDTYEVTASGYLARAFQHEIDHLAGKLFTDKIIEEIPEDALEAYMEEHFDE